MPLIENTWTGGGDGSTFGSGANWSLGHVPTSSEQAVINADDGAPIDDGGVARTLGALTIIDSSHDYSYSFPNLKILGDVQLTEHHADEPDVRVTLGNVGGNITFTDCNATFVFAGLTGSGKTLSVNSGPVDLNGLEVPANYTVSGNINNFKVAESGGLSIEQDERLKNIEEMLTAGGGTVIVTPIQAAVNNPRFTTRNLGEIIAGTAPADLWAITDGAGEPIDLSGKTIRFVVCSIEDPTPDSDGVDAILTGLYQYDTDDGITIGGDDDNQVTVQHAAENTAEAGVFRYFLINVTDSIVLAKGRMTVTPSVLVVA